MKAKHNASACPCGGMVKGASYAMCCQPYIEGRERAPTAEHLMRSRYTAYATGNAAYVLSTWHSSTRPAELTLQAAGAPHSIQWLGLAVHSHTESPDGRARVRFTARYREGGRAQRLQEHSRFVLENGNWLYLDGDADFDALAG